MILTLSQAEMWMDGFRVVMGKPMEERSSLDDIKTLVEYVFLSFLFLYC
jgi:hypothetical protein